MKNWCFFIGFILLSFYFSSPARAALLEQENKCILQGGGAGCTAGGGQGFDDKAFNLNQLGGTVDNLNYFLIGTNLAHPEIAGLNGGGAIADMGGLIARLYQPPASSVEYFAYLKQNLGLTSPAYAQQGTGYQGLQPLMGIWSRFRDAAYMVYILLFVVTGLLIMFRVKISPQAVVSIQNSLPRLLILLILITLSYAIAGLMIDLMYVALFFIYNLFQPTLPPGPFTLQKALNENTNVIGLFWDIPGAGWSIVNSAAETIRGITEGIIGNKGLGSIPGFKGFFGLSGQGIAWLVFAVAILFALVRLFFVLLKAYIWVLVMVIFGPFMLLTAAMPGSKGISGWIRGLLANLAVFPATLTMFLIGSALAGKGSSGPGWVAPFIGGSASEGIMPLVALGIILVTPTVAQMMNDAIKPPPFPYGAAVGQAIGAGPAMAGGIAGRVGRMAPYKTSWSWWRGLT